jgi:predicted MFS family arabinose efflux permease
LVPKPVPLEETESSSPDHSPSLFPIFLNAFLAMTVFFVAYITLPASLASRFELTEAETGYFMAFISLMAVSFAGCLPVIIKTVPANLLMSISFVFFGCGELLFARAGHMPGMLLGAVATGTGFGFSIPTANHLVVEQSAPRARGRNLSYLSMAIFLGQFASTFVTFGHSSAPQMLSRAGFFSFGTSAVGVLIFCTNRLNSRKVSTFVHKSW